MSPRRYIVAVVGLVSGAAFFGLLLRACAVFVDAWDLGPRVEVHPAIRAWDAGARRDR